MGKELAEIGAVKIADDVLARIAALAALEVDGVSAMAGNYTSDVLEKVSRKNLAKGAKVVVGQTQVKVDLALMMSYGYNIPATCQQAQTQIFQSERRMMNRSLLREQVFKLLFRVEFNPMEEMPEQEELFTSTSDDDFSKQDADYIREKYEKIAEKLDDIDKAINEKTKGWDTERMAKVELTIIRLAVYEIKHDESVPTGVAINEAVELAKKFGQDGSPAFVNGVLAKFAE